MNHRKMIKETADQLYDKLDELVDKIKQFFNDNDLKEYDCGTGVTYLYEDCRFYKSTAKGNYVIEISQIDFEDIITMAYDIYAI